MPSSPISARGDLLDSFQELFARQVDTCRRQGATLSIHSIETLASHMQSFERDLDALSELDRAAIVSAFRKELTYLILHARLEAAKRQFTPKPKRT